MAVTIEDLRNEELFRDWEGSSIFSNVIANNGIDADIKLWMLAREYAARIAQSSYNYTEENVPKVVVYYPASDFIRICGEIESDKGHDRWWKMTMRGVLFTMVCTFAFDDYFGKEKEMDGSVKDTEFCMMADCLDPDFSQFCSDDTILDHVNNILYEIRNNFSERGYIRYNVLDEAPVKKIVAANEEENKSEDNKMETLDVTEPIFPQIQDNKVALRAAIEAAMGRMAINRHWFCVLKVLIIHGFSIDFSTAAKYVKEVVGEEKLAEFKYKIDVDDLRKLDIGSMSKEVSKWEIDDYSPKGKRFEAYKNLANLFENDLLKAGLIEQAK